MKRRPTAARINEALVFHPAPIGDLVRFIGANPAIAEEPAAQRAKGQQLDVVVQCDLRQAARRAPVQQRKTDLIAGDFDPLFQRQPQVIGVEIGQTDFTNQAFLAQPHQARQRVQIFGRLILPPVELHAVHPWQIQPTQRGFNPGPDVIQRHFARRRAPFRQDRWGCLASLSQQLVGFARDNLGAAIVVGHVETVETVTGVIGQRLGCGIQVEGFPVTFPIGHLPKASDDATDRQAAEGGFSGSGHGAAFQESESG